MPKISPDRLFSVSMWLLSLLFAGFLTSLGAKVIADLPDVTPDLSQEQFADRPRLAALRQASATEERRQPELRDAVKAAEAAVRLAETESQAALRSHDEWLRTRHVTAAGLAGGTRDDALVAATAALQTLSDRQLVAERALRAAEDALRRSQQAGTSAERSADALLDAARPAYDHAVRVRELKVFSMRLALTLPLLGIAWWLVLRTRKSPRWPLSRGFVLFAANAFFFELVPYLPSYGGYVRSLVGVAITVAAGLWGIRAMQRYLAWRKAQDARNELERRERLDNAQAIGRMQSELCRPASARSSPPTRRRPTSASTAGCGSSTVAPAARRGRTPSSTIAWPAGRRRARRRSAWRPDDRYAPLIAVTSISIFMRGSASPAVIIIAAGRTSPK